MFFHGTSIWDDVDCGVESRTEILLKWKSSFFCKQPSLAVIPKYKSDWIIFISVSFARVVRKELIIFVLLCLIQSFNWHQNCSLWCPCRHHFSHLSFVKDSRLWFVFTGWMEGLEKLKFEIGPIICKIIW